ncbi:MAG TPA: restriction endonuclease subunit S [Candidatus Omnitrophica bacterium]|nr:restriction endonuclease subunit S [Candidatus Omnitrophota bacterium]
MKPYPEYNNSGISWLGKIPKHWKAKRLKYVAQANQEALPESTANDYEFNYVDIGNVGLEEGIKLGERINFAKAPSRARRIVRNGDTIVSTVRTYLKAVAHIDFEPKDIVCSTGFAVISPGAVIVPKFLYYILRSEKIIDRVEALSVGVSYPAINASELMGIAAWYPPSLDEQKNIADYLDRKTAQIDDLISKKEKLIELLKEERAAIINQAVTKGLDPKAELKNSGLPWLGKIPKHWKVKRLKYLLKNKKGALKTGPFGSQLKHSDMQGADIKVYTQRSVMDNDFDSAELYISNDKFIELSEFEIFPQDILLTTRGTIGKCAIFPNGKDKGILHPCLIRVQLNQNIISNMFAQFYMKESSAFLESINHNSNATTIAVIYGETLREVVFVVPDRNEQNKIVDFLNHKTQQIDTQIVNEKKSVEYLVEYRSTLISEVVTGKIDVRNNHDSD